MSMFTSLLQLEQQLFHNEKSWAHNYTLDRMQQAVVRLGHPELKYKVIHVGGTSGKGSTCQMIYAILRAAGKNVGIYISPHLVSSLERIVVNNRAISEKQFLSLVNQLWPKIEDLRLTYFELYTLMSLLYFAKQKVNYAVIEVGLGGRLDATNVVTPTIAVVTDIGLDHTEVLGKTKRAIAKEKEAIIKPGCIGLTGSKFVHRGKYINLEAHNIRQQDLIGTIFDYKKHKKVFLNLVGAYQVRNAVLAIEVTQALRIPKRAMYQGLAQVRSRARFEVVTQQPLVIMDGAHNPQKMTAFVKSLCQVVPVRKFEKVVLLLALKYNKDAVATLRPIVRLADTVVLTSFSQGMSLTILRKLVQQLNPKTKIIVQKNSATAYTAFCAQLQKNDLGIITGSLYMIGDLMKYRLHSS